MMLDIILSLSLGIAVFRGLREGFIKALCAFVGMILGLAAAMKLSAVLAQRWFENPAPWVPFACFIIVFLVVVFAVHLIGRLIEGSMKLVMMGWLNRLMGVVLYVLLYAVIASVILFYLGNLGWLSQDALDNSVLYPFFKPIGPIVVDKLSILIPVFKDVFTGLQEFFEGFEQKI